MNSAKARDFFSAYHEGTLESGLRQAFERRLQADPALQAEYHQFQVVMTGLGALGREPIETPADLDEQIYARLDRHLYEKKRKTPVAFGVWVRSLVLGGLAAGVLLAAVFSFRSLNEDHFQSSFISSGGGSPKIIVKDGVPHLQFRTSTKKTLVITAGEDGQEISRFILDRQSLDSPLQNPNAMASLLSIVVEGQPEVLRVAIPGTSNPRSKIGEGTARQFALALAGQFHMPVVVDVRDMEMRLNWKLEGVEPLDAFARSGVERQLSLEQRASGVLYLYQR